MEPDILKDLEPVKLHQLKFQLCIALKEHSQIFLFKLNIMI